MQSETKPYYVPYGKTSLGFRLPPGITGTEICSRPAEPVLDASQAIAQALAQRELGSKLEALIVPHALQTLPIVQS